MVTITTTISGWPRISPVKEERDVLLCTLTQGRLRAAWGFKYDYDDDDCNVDEDGDDYKDDSDLFVINI